MSAVRVKFGEVVSNLNETVRHGEEHSLTRVVGLEHIEPQDPNLRRWDELSDLPDGTSFSRVFRRGQVLFGKRRAYQRKVAVAPFDGICSGDILVFSPTNKKLHPDFLLFIVQSEGFFSHALQTSSGSLSPRTRWQDLATFEFELPSIEEQQRIVELLSGVDAHAEALRNQLHVANETRKSVLHHLLTAGGDDWTETTLGNVIQLSYGKALKAEDRDGDGFPVFGSAGEVGQHSEPNVPFVPVVIVGRKGTAGAVWWSDIPCSVIDTAYFLVLKAEGNPKYFYHLLESLDLPTLTAQTGVPGLNRDRVHSCEFLCPPLIEQQRIVDEVSKIDAVIQETTSALAATRQLRSALLNKEIS